MEIQYTIQMVSKITGVGQHTLRAWEKRYKSIVPKRGSDGHRIYDSNEINKIILFSKLCQIGYSISKISHLNLAELKEILIGHGITEEKIKELLGNEENKKNESFKQIDYGQSLTIILMALKAYKLDIVSSEIEKLKFYMSARDFAIEVILPIINELGMAVYRGDYTISHEHAFSSILKFHIGQILYQKKSKSLKKMPTIVFSGMEGDFHEFGILMAALIADFYKFKILYLGPNLPADSLIDVCNSLEIDMAVIGATVISKHAGTQTVEKYLEIVQKGIHKKTKLAIGTSMEIDLSKIRKKNFIRFSSLLEFDHYLKNFGHII